MHAVRSQLDFVRFFFVVSMKFVQTFAEGLDKARVQGLLLLAPWCL